MTYPYISRVLGVANIGLVNFVDSVIDYFLLFSMMGIAFTGVRETSINKDDRESLDRMFSSLFILNLVFTLCALVVLCCAVFVVPKFWEYKDLMLIGSLKLVFNLFLIEWFFQGIEKIKNVMLASLVVRIAYVILLFICVKSPYDIGIFYGLTSGVIIIKSIFNWFYGRRFVSLRYKYVTLKPYLRSCISFGLHGFLISMYTSFNIIFLGFTSGEIEVGYYTSAMKLYGVLIALFSAFTAVLLPRMSSLVSDRNNVEMNRLLHLSLEILLMIGIPVLIVAEFYAPEIITLLSGPGYEGSIVTMRIIIPLLIIVGLEQIMIIQILMPLKKDKLVLISSSVGAFVSIIFNFLLVKHYGSIGSSIVWVLVEFSILIFATYFVKKTNLVDFNFNLFTKYILSSIPYIIICTSVWNVQNLILKFSILVILSILYFFFYHMYINKTLLVMSFFKDLNLIGE
jgi:O-antigen/teichoic acid export membrane protein